jgi:hypothetical protein
MACAGSPSERSTTPTSEYATTSRRTTPVDSDASVVHLRHEPWGEFTIGGMPDGGAASSPNGSTELVAVNGRDAGAPARDAGGVPAELSWLVAHIADTRDRLRADDSDNARQLAARGADGVRAVVSVFARGDALRLPFARRVVERNVIRVCGTEDRAAAQELIMWIELGGGTPSAPEGPIRWSRTGDTPWSPAALGRLEDWIAGGMPCRPPESSTAPPSGSSRRPPASGRDAAAPRRP